MAYRGFYVEKNKGNETLAKEAFNQVVDNIAPIPLNILSNNEQLLMTGALAHKQLGNTQKARELIEYLVSRVYNIPSVQAHKVCDYFFCFYVNVTAV